MPNNTEKAVWWKHFVAGNCGGIIGLSLAYPMDTVKVRIQTRDAKAYRGVLNCIQQMVKHEGVTSLYRGLLSPVVGYGAINAMAFGSYNMAKQWFLDESEKKAVASGATDGKGFLSLTELGLCGMFAGTVQTTVRAPIEQIKTVMQARVLDGKKAPYRSTIHCLVDVLKTEGVYVGLYRSMVPTLAREIPQYGMYYPTYELAKRYLTPEPTPEEKASGETAPLAAWRLLLAGGIAGTVQWIPTYPTDVIKSRMSMAEPGEFKSAWDCTKQLLKAEGPGAFWRGLSASVYRAFPLHGMVFLGYELTMRLLNTV